MNPERQEVREEAWRWLDRVALVAFGVTLCWLAPLRTALQFGTAEGYELMKALLVSQGHPLYREVWNDQPPLHTELVALLFRLFGPSAYAGRLLGVGFAMVLVGTFFGVVRVRSGRAAGWMGVALLMASPAFLELSVSVMLEVPAIALGMAAVWAWDGYRRTERRRWLVASGLLFGCALQVKLTAAIFGPALALDWLAWRRWRWGPQPKTARPGWRVMAGEAALWSGSVGLAFGAVVLAFYQWDTLSVFWGSHFSVGTRRAAATGFEFDWPSLLQAPGLVLSASLGVMLLMWQRRAELLFPLVLLGTVLIVHAVHRPYWYYYALHFAPPLAWLGAAGLVEGGRALRWPRAGLSRWGWVELALGVLLWFLVLGTVLTDWPARLRTEVRRLTRTVPASADPAVIALRQRAAGTRWIFTEHLIAAFWARLPVPPELAVIPAKRVWSGQIDGPEFRHYLAAYQPRLLLGSPGVTRDFGLEAYLAQHYRLVVDEPPVELYVRRP